MRDLSRFIRKAIAAFAAVVMFSGYISGGYVLRADGARSIEAFVTRLYNICLDRDPDPQGFNSWVQALRSGEMSGYEAAEGFVFSPEFTGKNLDNETYVCYLYRILLGRDPDPVGRSYWTDNLERKGWSRQDVFDGFSGSQEWMSLCREYGIDPIPFTIDSITDAEITEFFGQSVLIGSSVTAGFNEIYFRSGNRGIMGDVLVCARGSYSLLNDMTSRSAYIPMLNGVPMRARDIIRNSGRKYAFICMGTNDIVNGVVGRYTDYLDDIRSVNPDVVIFVEACTPSRDDHPANTDIDALNRAMRSYCDSHDNVYYVDTNTPFKDGTGVMAARYSSDGNVHMTYSGYSKWCDILCDCVRNYIFEQRTSSR